MQRRQNFVNCASNARKTKWRPVRERRLRMRNTKSDIAQKRNEYNERFRRADDRNLRLILFTVVIYARCCVVAAGRARGPGHPKMKMMSRIPGAT